MNKSETLGIMAALEIAYPRFYANKTKDEKDAAINLWSKLFKSDDAKIVTEAVNAMICTLEFPPTIADIKKKIALLTQPKTSTELEAWNKVWKAIQDANYRAQEYFDSFPPQIQQLVGSPGQLREWALMDSKVINSVIQSNFMRSYKSKIEQDKEYSMLPESAKKLIADLSQKMLMDGGQDAKA
ncbi:loader and inhibitor of phage G40P [Ruminiclostridium hungatei]|uniref:Loader and inhibitor of phage G40P n=1 Tax=Ruminiclostridium hungatei TaxID=48256 RepID=A0A1V4SSD0_RUMHU|nr:replicative helicase loader/inhibitor [Ruminiclostridium hungatei]OPX46355.1 loader and inhibitor of phage G40P [Ruminiclostridium hungatei]